MPFQFHIGIWATFLAANIARKEVILDQDLDEIENELEYRWNKSTA